MKKLNREKIHSVDARIKTIQFPAKILMWQK